VAKHGTGTGNPVKPACGWATSRSQSASADWSDAETQLVQLLRDVAARIGLILQFAAADELAERRIVGVVRFHLGHNVPPAAGSRGSETNPPKQAGFLAYCAVATLFDSFRTFMAWQPTVGRAFCNQNVGAAG
jgi:hypothetical protein